MKQLLAACLLLCLLQVQAQDQSLFTYHQWVNKGDTLPYRLLLPKNYDAGKKYPVVFFLHGAGERGNDNEKQLVHGSKLFLNESNRDSFPAIVVFPQCPANSYWSNVNIVYDSLQKKRVFSFTADGEPTKAMNLLMQLVQYITREYSADNKRIYVGGLSMGGMGTFEITRRKPKVFAAAFAICGGANPSTAEKIKHIPWWIFHGMKDDVVPPENSINMVDALLLLQANVRFTKYPLANHNSWDSTFAEPGLLAWLFSNHK